MLWAWLVGIGLILALLGVGLWLAFKQQKNSRWYYNKAIDCYEHEDWHKALEYLSQAYELEADYPPIPYNIGVVYLNLGDLEQAKAFFEATLELDSEDISALYNLGFIYFEEHQYKKALANWQQTEFLSREEDPELFFCLGLAYEATGEPEVAIAVLYKTLMLDETHRRARLTLAKILSSLEQFEDTITQLELLLKHDPYDAEINYEMALCLLKTNQWDAAITFCKKSLAIDSQNAKVYNQLGLAYYCTEQVRESIEQFQKAVTLDKEYATAYNNLGYALEKLGYSQEALAAFTAYAERETNIKELTEVQKTIKYLENKLQGEQQHAVVKAVLEEEPLPSVTTQAKTEDSTPLIKKEEAPILTLPLPKKQSAASVAQTEDVPVP